MALEDLLRQGGAGEQRVPFLAQRQEARIVDDR